MSLKNIKLTAREKRFLKETDEKKVYRMTIRKNASPIRQEVLIEKFKELKNDYWIYLASKDWEGLPIDLLIEKFKELKDNYLIYNAGKNWEGLPTNLLIEKFKELKDEGWIYWAGEEWKGLPTDVLIEKFKELKNEYWIYSAGEGWKGLPTDVLIEKFKELKNKGWIYEAGENWNGIPDEIKYEKLVNMLENAEMTKGFIKEICDNENGWYKSDISLELKLLFDALKDNVFDLKQRYTRNEIEMLLLGYNFNKNDKNIEFGF